MTRANPASRRLLIVTGLLLVSITLFLVQSILGIPRRTPEPSDPLITGRSGPVLILVKNNAPGDQLSAAMLLAHTNGTLRFIPDQITPTFLKELRQKNYRTVYLLGKASQDATHFKNFPLRIIAKNNEASTNLYLIELLYGKGAHFQEAYLTSVEHPMDALNALPRVLWSKAPLFLLISENWLPNEVDQYAYDRLVLLGAPLPPAFYSLPKKTVISGANRSETSAAFARAVYSPKTSLLKLKGHSFYTDYLRILKERPQGILLQKTP